MMTIMMINYPNPIIVFKLLVYLIHLTHPLSFQPASSAGYPPPHHRLPLPHLQWRIVVEHQFISSSCLLPLNTIHILHGNIQQEAFTLLVITIAMQHRYGSKEIAWIVRTRRMIYSRKRRRTTVVISINGCLLLPHHRNSSSSSNPTHLHV